MANSKFLTSLSTQLQKIKTAITSFSFVNRTSATFTTKIHVISKKSNMANTDIRFNKVRYDEITPKSLSDFIVYKGAFELPGVDYTTLKIRFALNQTPSSATFILARRHDDFDKTIDGAASVISAENKIQIYDGARLLFTGYITKINCISDTDTVEITAEDIRYKMHEQSIHIFYGFYTSNPAAGIVGASYISRADAAFMACFSAVGISCSISFGGKPEPTEVNDTCANAADSIIRNSANINWYTDENEVVRFQYVESGPLKRLDLSGVNSQRNIYDVIVDNISINKIRDNYYTGFSVKLGKEDILYYHQSVRQHFAFPIPYFVGNSGKIEMVTSFTEAKFNEYVDTLTVFPWADGQVFVVIDGVSPNTYIGSSLRFDNELISKTFDWSLNGFIVYQYYSQKSTTDISHYFIGSNSGPTKEVDYSSYGIQRRNKKIEIVDGYYSYVVDEQWNRTNYAKDLARFELSQSNKPLTEATITLILDAFEYKNINFGDLINIGNTIEPGCFENVNGFPLNIADYEIDCSNRIVRLSLTNYGKTYYNVSSNFGSSHTERQVSYIYPSYKPEG